MTYVAAFIMYIGIFVLCLLISMIIIMLMQFAGISGAIYNKVAGKKHSKVKG